MVSHEIQSEVGLALHVGLLSGLGVALGYTARVPEQGNTSSFH